VMGRMLHVDEQAASRGRRVVGGPLGYPALYDFHLAVSQRVLAPWHRRWFAPLWDDLPVNRALVRLMGDNAGIVLLGFVEQFGEPGHDEAALGLGRLVATLTMLLKDGPHVLVVADLVGLGFLFRGLGQNLEPRQKQ